MSKDTIRKQLLQSAEEQIRRGVPRMRIYKQWLNLDLLKMDLEHARAYLEATNIIEGVMVDRNVRGIALEKAGRIDEAIQLYEANVADEFDGSHPYTRLRVLYTKNKDYHNAIRICEAYLSDMKPQDRARSQFQKQMEKLRAKLTEP